MRIYIAGPMTDYPRHNFPAFDWAKVKLLEIGYEVISPADIDRSMGIFEDTPFAEVKPRMREIAAKDMEALKTCDSIYMLKGWERSTGARAEHAHAVWTCMDIYYERGI